LVDGGGAAGRGKRAEKVGKEKHQADWMEKSEKNPELREGRHGAPSLQF